MAYYQVNFDDFFKTIGDCKPENIKFYLENTEQEPIVSHKFTLSSVVSKHGPFGSAVHVHAGQAADKSILKKFS